MVIPTVTHRIDRRALLTILSATTMFLVGCTTIQTHRQLAEQLAVGPEPQGTTESSVEELYRVGFPDVLEIVVPGRPDCTGVFPITAEGRLEIGALRNPRIEGDTAAGVSRKLGDMLGFRPGEVRCRVARHARSFVYVYGPVSGPERAVAYHGPESVVSLIRRIGGVQPGAQLKDVRVVRGNVASGQTPQVFTVDLEAILLHGNPESNVALQPFDSIYLGEMQRSKFGKALPHWMRPAYRGFCNVFPEVCPHDWRPRSDSLPKAD